MGTPPSTLAAHPDGVHRRTYSEDSTESWLSDYGAGQLVNGRATVPLEADFAAVVRADEYLVFLTPRGDCNGLYVAGQTPTGFEVRELKGGSASLAFAYRVMAKRRDVAAPRMERVPVPRERPRLLPAPQLPDLAPSGRTAPPATPTTPAGNGSPPPTTGPRRR